MEEITRFNGSDVQSAEEESPRSHLGRNLQPLRLRRRALPLTLSDHEVEHRSFVDEVPNVTDQEHAFKTYDNDTLVGNTSLNSNADEDGPEAMFRSIVEELDDEHTLATVFASPERDEMEDSADAYNDTIVNGTLTVESDRAEANRVLAIVKAEDTDVVVLSVDKAESDDMLNNKPGNDFNTSGAKQKKEAAQIANAKYVLGGTRAEGVPRIPSIATRMASRTHIFTPL